MSKSAESLPQGERFDPNIEWVNFYYGERHTDHVSTTELMDARAHGVVQKMLPYPDFYLN